MCDGDRLAGDLAVNERPGSWAYLVGVGLVTTLGGLLFGCDTL